MKRINGKVCKKKKVHIGGKLIVLLGILIIIIAFIIVSNMCNIKNIKIIIEKDISNTENNPEQAEVQPDSSIKITEEGVKNLANLKIGENIFKTSKSEIADRLRANPYIDNIEITKSITGNITIKVTQKEVKYIINYAGAYIYVDSRRIYIRSFL